MQSLKRWSLKTSLLSAIRYPLSALFLYAAFSLCSLSPATAHASDFSILPSIAASEEYTDNVFQTQTDKKTDFITHLTPGLAFQYRAPFWDWDLAYLLDYRYYARNSQGGQFSHNLNTKGNLRVIENFLFLDVNDTYQKVSLDVNRDTTASSTFVNQADQNILTVAPHIEFHPSANFLVKSGYHYTRESYMNASSVNNSLTPFNNEEHGAFIATAYELSPNTTITTNFACAHVDTGQSNNQVNTGQALSYNQLLPTLAIRYEYAAKSFISLEGGYSWFLYDHGHSESYPYWNAGITHSFDHIVVALNTLVKFNTDPLQGSTEEQDVSARLEKTMNRGSMGLFATYSEFRNNQQDLLDSRNYQIGANIKHELTEKVTGHIDLTGEKVNIKNNNNINYDITAPYQFYIGAGLAYTLVNNLTLALDYSYTTYRQSIGSSTNNTEINRVILGLSKSFGEVLKTKLTGDSDKGPATSDQRVQTTASD
jgi:hypothetical protein